MNDYRSLVENLDIEDRRFLAGVIFARGKLYIGKSKRGTGFRYSPMLTVELSMPLPRHFEQFFDGPYERRYYGNATLRYALQDQEKITLLLEGLLAHFPSTFRPRVQHMIGFCKAADDRKSVTYEQFVGV